MTGAIIGLVVGAVIVFGFMVTYGCCWQNILQNGFKMGARRNDTGESTVEDNVVVDTAGRTTDNGPVQV